MIFFLNSNYPSLAPTATETSPSFTSDLKPPRQKPSPIEEINITDEFTNTEDGNSSHEGNKTLPSPDIVDLSKSLPNHGKKKANVTRSFSYTIGHLTGANQHSVVLKASRKSEKANNPTKANRSSFSHISSAFGLGRSTGHSLKPSSKKRPSLVREDVVNDTDETQLGHDSTALGSLGLTKHDVDATPIFKTGKEELQNVYDFQHVSVKKKHEFFVV